MKEEPEHKMGVSLSRGESMEIVPGVIRVEVGWSAAALAQECDIDASALLLDSRRKLPNDEAFVFYNNPRSRDHSVELCRDKPPVGTDSDVESFRIDLVNISRDVDEILFVLSLYDAGAASQSLAQIPGAFIRVHDVVSGQELCRYEPPEAANTETCLGLSRLCRTEPRWQFEATHIATRSLSELIKLCS